MKILGIETSCDETAAAIVESGVKVLSNVIASSKELHKKTGGIIPEVAAREQIKCIIPIVSKAMKQCSSAKIDAISVTVGPGLIGSLLVGVETAKALAYVWNKPIVPVNHLIAHIYGNFVSESQILNFKSRIEFPAIVLIVSGGHTEILLMKDHGNFRWLGGTQDDAAGEAFDKVAKLLGLGYPGGPAIQKAAVSGGSTSFELPRPMMGNKNYNFSFSGLKTAVFYTIKNEGLKMKKEDLAASFQQAVADVLVEKTIRAVKKFKARSILLAGGVAANKLLRETFEKEIERTRELEIKFFCPPVKFCTDNAVIVASAAYFNYKPVHWSKIKADPGLSLKK